MTTTVELQRHAHKNAMKKRYRLWLPFVKKNVPRKHVRICVRHRQARHAAKTAKMR